MPSDVMSFHTDGQVAPLDYPQHRLRQQVGQLRKMLTILYYMDLLLNSFFHAVTEIQI